MNKKVYYRGLLGQYWYNFTEALVYGLVYRPTPKDLLYTKKIKYGNGKLQYINFNERKDLKSEKKPLLVYIHGGSWVSGITEMRNAYISQWAKKGFFTAAVSYSYAPQKIFPYQLQEVFTAIDFIIDHAEEYNIDTEKIVLAGESAGGYFISYIASVLYNQANADSLGLNFAHKEIKLKALVSISGCYDLHRLSDESKPQSDFPDLKTMIKSYLGEDYETAKKLIHSESGKTYSPEVNAGYPPSFLIWADKDKLRYETFDFAEELKSFGVEYKLYKADGIIGMHAWAIVPLFRKSRICFEKTYEFVKSQI